MPFEYWIDYIALCLVALWPVTGIFIPIRRCIAKNIPFERTGSILDNELDILISILSGALTFTAIIIGYALINIIFRGLK